MQWGGRDSHMKTEDIDKKIGMPDVDEEWAKFEREVIGQPKASKKPLYWGISIAASIALVAGIFLFGQDAEEQQVIYLAQKQATNDVLQGHIGGLNITGDSDSARQARRDSLLRQREINMDSMLIVVNGTPIPLYKFNRKGIAPYLYKQHQLLSDSDLNVEERIGRALYQPYGGSEEERKRRCFETYGDRAKYGVLEVTTVPDTYCDEYISKHPELKKERHHIEGYVYDEDDKPLADAWVNVRDKGIGAATDSKGYFSLWLPQTDVELMTSHMGNVPYVVKTIKPMLTIRLKSATTLKDVKVRGKRVIDSIGAKAIPIKEINIKDYR